MAASSKPTKRLTPTQAEPPPKRIDGRSMHKTGRTVPFGTKVTAEFDQKIREAALRDGKMFAEVLEEALDLYEARHAKRAERRG